MAWCRPTRQPVWSYGQLLKISRYRSDQAHVSDKRRCTHLDRMEKISARFRAAVVLKSTKFHNQPNKRNSNDTIQLGATHVSQKSWTGNGRTASAIYPAGRSPGTIHLKSWPRSTRRPQPQQS